ncbi:DUF4383 domain-containing protein [Promicromonospora sp. CA-289599]|uniref:DUF4383 domain-containing protein n=1 Tax=Promicromonospora sp. CA-289599 TaxID=3240014 RepID=UPI003D89C214
MAQEPESRHALASYQWLVFAIGVIYLTIGVAGFFVTSPAGFASRFTSQDLFGLAVNPLFKIAHLSTGFLGVIVWSSPGGARAFGWVTTVGYGAMFGYGIFLLNSSGISDINVNRASNWLHALSIVAGLAAALWPDRRNVTSPGRRHAS